MTESRLGLVAVLVAVLVAGPLVPTGAARAQTRARTPTGARARTPVEARAGEADPAATLGGAYTADAIADVHGGIRRGMRTLNGAPYRARLRREGVTASVGEVAAELTYRASVSSVFSLQPDVQYVVHPGTDPEVANALVFGLRLHFDC